MRIVDFVLDRIALISIYLINTVLLLLVVELDLLQAGSHIQRGSAVYMVVLSLTGLVSILTFDYLRQRSYLRNLRHAASQDDNYPGLVPWVTGALTREQRLWEELLLKKHRRYIAEVEHLQRQHEQHLDFTNQWAHYMKTPVSVVNLLLQKAKGATTMCEARDLFESIGEENDRLTRGIEMVLCTARLGRFEVDLRPQQVDLVSIVRDIINDHRRELIHSHVYPKIDSDSDPMYVATDEKWIRFVIKQIISNAIKYSRVKDVSDKRLIVSVRSGRRLGDGPETVLSITDEGVGIPEHDLPRIFEPFFTGDNGRLVHASTGMGLYLAKEVCDRLGHSIAAQSSYGQGTTISITFSSNSLIARVLH